MYSSATPPASLRYGSASIFTAISVSTISIIVANVLLSGDDDRVIARQQHVGDDDGAEGSPEERRGQVHEVFPRRIWAKKKEPGGSSRHAGRGSLPNCRKLAFSFVARSEQALEQLAHLRRVARDREAALFHDGELGVGRVGAAGDQRARVAHALAGRSRDARDEADDRLLHVVLAPASRV